MTLNVFHKDDYDPERVPEGFQVLRSGEEPDAGAKDGEDQSKPSDDGTSNKRKLDAEAEGAPQSKK